MTSTTWVLLLMTVAVWLDARNRNCKNAILWTVGTFLLPIVVAPLYLAKRPLKEGEIREGGVLWNACRSFALLWTVIFATVLLCGGVDYERLGSGTYGGLTQGVFFLIAGGIWFGAIVVALVVGMFGKNNAIVERGSPIIRQGTLASDLKKLGILFGSVIAIGAFITGGAWIFEHVSTGIETIKQAWATTQNHDRMYLYPVEGADDTVVNVPASEEDPAGAKIGLRHPLPGTKVEIIGDGPGSDGKAKQIRILEGEFSGLEGWTYTDCLRKDKVAVTPAHNSPASGPIKWTFRTNGQVECSPAHHNGTVFFGSDDRNLYAVDEVTGAERWHFQASAGVDGGVTVANGAVFCGSKNGIFYALRETDGHLLWKYEPPQVNDTSAIFTTPLVSNGKVYFGSLTGLFRALDATTGKQIWQFKAQAEVNSSPVILNGIVFFGSRDDYLYAFDAATGTEQWRMNINGTINDAPVIDRGSIIFAAVEYDPTGGSIYAVDAKSGSQQWRTQIARERTGDFSPIVVGNRVFCTASGLFEQHDKNFLYCLNRTDGGILWKREVPKVMTSLSQYKTNVVFGSTDGLYIASMTDGELKYSERCGEIQLSKPNIVGSTVYVGSTDKSFYAIGIPTTLAGTSIASSYPMVSSGGGTIASTGGGMNAKGLNGTLGSSPLGETTGSYGGVMGSATPNSEVVTDPALIPLQGQNKAVVSEVKSLRQINQKMQNENRSLREQLDDAQRTIDEQERNISRLQNNLTIADEIRQSKDSTISDLTNTASRLRSMNSSNSSDSQNRPILNTTSTESEESPDVVWPNVQDFQPSRYRRDVLRRLYRIALSRSISESSICDAVSLRFIIEKDGRPTNIEIVTPVPDEEIRKRCVMYIEAAGPFRPLLPDDLPQLSVDTQLAASGNQVRIENLQIGALGNKL